MPNTSFSPSIESRPTYAGLVPQGAAPSIMIADAEGAEAILDLVDRDAAVLDQAHLIYIPKGAQFGSKLAELGAKGYHEEASLDAAMTLINRLLGAAHMGTQLYLAGSEGMMGRISALALSLGLPLDAIQMEHRGSIGRPMQCVHCKGVTQDVTTDPFTCSHCGLTLFVRDHFSRRLGVFQAVCVDAETPGVIPETQEITA
ncbi:hypothetical protein SAMN04488117_104296 [Celeribacter baekdonensis]|jgi:predicted RNA-binding Zn-ribbon protein involved in translation (DUF1610 family)|uniref:Uncharacterized protein n=1 Tax=Celeribacter baekdonensis TaxID=875171 RepID=A0A1G7LHA2_9RHOB|nr:dimethylamine monooxygenase subunit DmmA family protein [Celeribacter baekdonensis]SDF48801.1 hypothetical protein SAMN04488117_104296 [Celeribacter baekdonensis]